MSNFHNTSETNRVYNAAWALGDTSPSLPAPQLPPPQSSGKCGGIGRVLTIVMAVAATVLTAGAAAVAMGAVTGVGIGSAGAAVLSGGLAGGGIAGGMGFAAAGAAALGGAAGSIAGQGMGMALGNRESFSWREVAMSAVGSAIGSGVGQSGLGQLTFGLQGNSAGIASAMARSAITSSALQAVSMGAGSQGRFSWRAVAASAVGAGVGAGMGAAFGASAPPGGIGMTPAERFGELARGTVYSIAAGSAASAIGSGRVMARQVAIDAFGNALGNGVAEMSGRGSTSGLQAASGGFPLYAANQVGTTMNDAGPDIDPRPRGGLEDVTVTARRLGADDEVKVYYGDRLIQSFFDNTPTGRAVSGFGEAASAWIDRNRAEYNQYYDSRLRDASSPMSTALARTGRALSNAPFDLGAGAVGLYTLATDRNVQARTLSAIGGALMNPVSTAAGALGATRSYLANTSLPQMAEDVTRVAAGAALTGGLSRP